VHAQVADLGVHSVVSLPLRVGDDVFGAMNVYAHAYDAFDERSAELGESFAAPAAIAVQHAQVLEQTRRLAEQLQTELTTRTYVEQAVGVLIGRDNLDVDEARRRLDVLSAERDEPVGVVARTLVEDAVRLGDARRSTDR
jgi:transcriptional regulator with GAF, ATPase, and Fis domain